MAMATTKTKAMDTYFMGTKNDCPIERQETMWGPNARFMHSRDGGVEATIVMSVALLVSLSFKHTGGGVTLRRMNGRTPWADALWFLSMEMSLMLRLSI